MPVLADGEEAMNNRLLIRADASASMGTGHVMRCLALAQAWQDQGGTATFLCSRIPKGLESRLVGEGMDVRRLEVESGSVEDARAAGLAARKVGVKWVVVDGYQFGASYQWVLKNAGFRVLFLDDYGHAGHYYADLILNQNIYASDELYLRRDPVARLLLGTRYALLRREFLRWRGWERHIPDVARKILVTMGGSDPANVTGRILEVISAMALDGLEVAAVVGTANTNIEALRTVADRSSLSIRLDHAVEDMSVLMAWADAAVSAAGSTCWELLAMGLPAAVVPLSDNQVPIAAALDAAGTVVRLEPLARESWGDTLELLLTNWNQRASLSTVGRTLVDTQGAARVCNYLSEKEMS